MYFFQKKSLKKLYFVKYVLFLHNTRYPNSIPFYKKDLKFYIEYTEANIVFTSYLQNETKLVSPQEKTQYKKLATQIE